MAETLPFGNIEAIRGGTVEVSVKGWSIDPDLGAPAYVDVVVDDIARTIRASGSRPDVGAAYPYYGSAHGFDLTISATPGRHVVCVIARDRGSFTSTFLAFAAVEVAGPAGHLDVVRTGSGAMEVAGWLVDPFVRSGRATARLVVDHVEVARASTSVGRPDVAAAYPGVDPHCGFDFRVPASPGRHLVCVDLIYGSGRPARLACAEAVVS
jgi:hypothetical protein